MKQWEKMKAVLLKRLKKCTNLPRLAKKWSHTSSITQVKWDIAINHKDLKGLIRGNWVIVILGLDMLNKMSLNANYHNLQKK